METAIRWAPGSNLTEQRFLTVDVNGRSFQHCQVKSYDGQELGYDVLSAHRKVPPFRAFDWHHDEHRVAIGQWSGEASVLILNDESQILSLPVKHQRLCNAVAFSKGDLLATGLERVRNDFCLHVWDVGQGSASRSVPSSPQRPGSGRSMIEPLRKFASSEGITSVKFFPQPETLVAGVRGTCIRIYDVRNNTGEPSLQMRTSCVHNIAVDELDENYFACAAPAKDSTIQIWDRRAASSSVSMIGTGLGNQSQHGPTLEFKNAFTSARGSSPASIWSLKFCKSRRGHLGALASTGDCKVFQIEKQYVSQADSRGDPNSQNPHDLSSNAMSISTKRISHFVQASDNGDPGPEGSSRIDSFDFTNLGGPHGRACAITLKTDQTISIREVAGSTPTLSLSSFGALALGEGDLSSLDGLHPVEDPGLENIMKLISPDEERSASQFLLTARSKMSKPDGGQSSSAAQMSSRETHEILCRVDEGITLKDALTLSNLIRRRCKEGYLFNCKKNMEIVSDDGWLQDMWAWIGRAKGNAADGGMVASAMDLSFLGVSAIWNNDLGSQKKARIFGKASDEPDVANAVESLAKSLQLPGHDAAGSAFPSHRRLCLHACGWALSRQQMEATLKELLDEGQTTRAALLAVVHERPELALNALRDGKPTAAYRELSLALAGYVKGVSDDMWEKTVQQVAKDLDDPHARAILALSSHGDWNDVLHVTALPLKDRILVALMHLNDQDLTSYIKSIHKECIREGDVEGIILTGLTEHSVSLFQNYMSKFADSQTPVLALSFTSPRYFTDLRVNMWREAYRLNLNTYRLFVQRVQFDVQATKFSMPLFEKDARPLLAPAPRQVSLKCNNCDQALDREMEHTEPSNIDTPSFGSSQRTSIFGDIKAGTVCPKCGRHMPRCVICMLWLGMPEPYGKGVAGGTFNARKPATEALKSPEPSSNGVIGQQKPSIQADTQAMQGLMKEFITICRACWHMSHGSHAAEWFRGHDTCAVPGCDCRCALLDGGQVTL